MGNIFIKIIRMKILFIELIILVTEVWIKPMLFRVPVKQFNNT